MNFAYLEVFGFQKQSISLKHIKKLLSRVTFKALKFNALNVLKKDILNMQHIPLCALPNFIRAVLHFSVHAPVIHQM